MPPPGTEPDTCRGTPWRVTSGAPIWIATGPTTASDGSAKPVCSPPRLGPRVGHLHAHFLHTPASVARYAALMTGLDWTCSAHAKDIYTSPEWEIAEKLADCKWLVTCTAANREFLARLAPDPGRVDLVYHGLDLARWPDPRNARVPGATAPIPADPVVIVSVGRAVEKEGLRRPDCRLCLAAGQPGLAPGPYRRRAAPGRSWMNWPKQAGLTERITWRGAQAQDAVRAAYHDADFFALAPRIAERRRPRWPAQCHDGGPEPGPGRCLQPPSRRSRN